MAKDVTLVLRGTVHWAKLTGSARPYDGHPKYDKGPYWSVDLTPDAKSRALLKEHGLDKGGQNGTGKLRSPKSEKDQRTEPFISLKILENRSDGKKNPPPEIKDATGRGWGDDLIGNGSVMDIMVKVKDYGSASEKGMYFQKGRVLSLVEYDAADFAPLSEDDEYFAASEGEQWTSGQEDAPAKADSKASDKAPADDDLDDDVPF